MERAIIFTLRLWNSGASFAARPSSVVQTGVKSRGWEKRMPHLKEKSRRWRYGEVLIRFVLQTESCTDCAARTPVQEQPISLLSGIPVLGTLPSQSREAFTRQDPAIMLRGTPSALFSFEKPKGMLE